MGLFGRSENDFDDSAAFDSDKGAVIKIVLLVLVIGVIVGGAGWIGYNQYQKMNEQTESNTTTIIGGELPKGTNPGEVVVNFTDFNVSVRTNPQGLYYYTTQEKVTGEKCYINGLRKDCRSLTNKVCSERTCNKELITVTECFVNNEKIDCPST